VGAIAPPEDGPAKIRLAVSVAHVTENVPAVVIGEPATDNSAGTVRATLVTVPVPAAPFDAAVIRPLLSTVIEESV
jgi:hypothetical protein